VITIQAGTKSAVKYKNFQFPGFYYSGVTSNLPACVQFFYLNGHVATYEKLVLLENIFPHKLADSNGILVHNNYILKVSPVKVSSLIFFS